MPSPPRLIACRACGRSIVFLPTSAGKSMPVDADSWDRTPSFDASRGHVSHFATCPAADRFRRIGARVQARRGAIVSRETDPGQEAS